MILLLELIKRNWLYVLFFIILCLLSAYAVCVKMYAQKIETENATCQTLLLTQNAAIKHQAKLAKEAELKAAVAQKDAHSFHERELDKIKSRVENVPENCEEAMAYLVDRARSKL